MTLTTGITSIWRTVSIMDKRISLSVVSIVEWMMVFGMLFYFGHMVMTTGANFQWVDNILLLVIIGQVLLNYKDRTDYNKLLEDCNSVDQGDSNQEIESS